MAILREIAYFKDHTLYGVLGSWAFQWFDVSETRMAPHGQTREPLCSVLKGRYYPDGDLLNADCPKSSSRTLRAMIHGKKMLKESLVRRIGDSHSTTIWHDKWIFHVHVACLSIE